MKYRILISLVFVLNLEGLLAQPIETIYQGTIIKSGYVDDACYGPFNIGFNFTFFGNTYAQFYANTNGQVLFGAASSSGAEAVIPTSATPNNFIAAFWDDLIIDGTGKILYSTIGAAPNRRLIIQFNNMGFYGPPTFMGSFIVILNESSNIIQVQYRLIVNNSSTRAHGLSATVGIENSDGTNGVQYVYHLSTDITSGKAISFSPTGLTYTLVSNSIYEWLSLTTNIAQPEPSIPNLLTPPQDATIGSDYKFEWTDAGNAASYSLIISGSSDLGGGTTYSPGTNTNYNVSGLSIDTTYYWGVFATNSTGTTWCEINKFTTSSNPPLAAVPEINWVEINQDNIISLDYTGGDASLKTAIITSLPSQGQLFQYNAGVRGVAITSIPATVSDASMNVIYAANSTSGNGVGNFSFKIHDDNGDSPVAQISINVSPAGMPSLLYAGKSTTYIELQFDKIMADPIGQESQFIITRNGSPVSISSLSLKVGDPNSIIAILGTTINVTDVITISYSAGNITSSIGGLLASFNAQTVTLLAQTISFPTDLSKKYGDPPLSLTASSSSGLTAFSYSSSNLAVATISGSVLTILTIGNADITARQSGNPTWAPAKYTKTLSVAKGDQTITFAPLPTKVYGDSDFTLSATSSSGLNVTFSSGDPSVVTVSGNIVHITGAGTAVITASQAGNSFWNAAPDVQRTLTVNKGDQTIIFGPVPAKTYGDNDFSPGGISSSGLAIDYSSDNSAVATIVSGMIHIIGAGTANITASQTGNSNYNPATPVIQHLTVNKANQTITFGALPAKTYGNIDLAPGAASSSGLSVSYSSDNTAVATIVSGMIHVTGAGSANITASQSGDSNFNPATDVINSLTINKAGLTITAEDKTKEYLASLPSLTYTFNGFVNGEDQAVIDVLPSIQTTALQNSAVGSYPISLTGGSDNNYALTLVAGTLTVTKISQSISFTAFPAETLLAGNPFTLAAAATSGLTVSFESLDPSVATVTGGNILTGVSAGTARIRAYSEGDANYEATETLANAGISTTHRDIMYLFTPNGDGFNDYWELPQLMEWGKCSVKVYNRWGKLVYDNPEYNNLWDGISDGKPVTEGAYYFVIKTENAGIIKGTLNIVR